MSRTHTTATDGAVGGERLEEATTTGKEAGAKASRESHTRTLKKNKQKKTLSFEIVASISSLFLFCPVHL